MLSVDAETFLQEVEQASRITPVVVDFWGENCGPCKALTSALERLEPEFSDRIKFVKFDVGLPDHQELTNRWGVRGIPTLVAISGGEPVRRSVGNLPVPELRNFFKAVLAGAGDAQATFRTGLEALEKGDRARGVALLRDALDSDPSHVDSRLTLLLETGRNPVPVDEKALAAVAEDLWRLFPPFATLAHTAYPLEIEALQLRMNGLSDRAIMPSTTSLQEQLRISPKDDWARVMLARRLIAEGAFKEAAELAVQGVEFGNTAALIVYFRTFRAAHILAGTWNKESEEQMARAMEGAETARSK
jgi:thioredoxin-like negative regulator of GroEL